VEQDGREGWYATSTPNMLRKSFRDKGRSKQMVFDVHSHLSSKKKKETVRIEVRWEWMGNTETTPNSIPGRDEQDDLPKRINEPDWDRGDGNKSGRERRLKKGEGSYVWVAGEEKGWEDGEGVILRGVERVVDEAGRWVE